jgi:ABC-type transport system involved in cytochrome c biogenesis permease subunit
MKSFALLIGMLLSLLVPLSGQEPEDQRKLNPSVLPPKWEKETVAAWERVPIRDGGRIKPLLTFANYELLRTRGMTSLRLQLTGPDPATGKMVRDLTPVEWLLDCMFYPEAAKQYPCFTVDDGEAVVRAGLKAHIKKRDLYSYNELVLGRDRLAQIQDDVDRKKELAKQKNEEPSYDYLDEMAANLARNVGAFETLIQAAAPLRRQIPIAKTLPEGPLVSKQGQTITTSAAVAHLKENPLWQEMMRKLAETGTADPEEIMLSMVTLLKDSAAWKELAPRSFTEMGQFGPALEKWMTEKGTFVSERAGLGALANLSPYLLLDMKGGARVAIVPPFGGADKGWHSLGDLPKVALGTNENAAAAVELLQAGEKVLQTQDQQPLRAFAERLIQGSQGKEGTQTIGTEMIYRKANFLGNSKVMFIILFLLIAFTWLAPQAAWSNRLFKACYWLMWLPLLAILASMTLRVLISGWAPVTNLYETIPLITFTAVGLAFFAEKIFKNRLSLGIAAFMGAAGTFMAGAFEASEASDTIHSLEAVLRSGFWLWTHVICEVIAYGAAVLGGGFSVVYIFARLFDMERTKASFFKMMTTCAYGILCFTLFFILVGTVLGGIWGNYSWGRFWGWDPKENGALVITLWCLVVLHMRFAGWIKEFGFHIMNVLGINAIIFSWWHVNELGVGLHAYGRSEGRLKYIFISYAITTLIALFGGLISWLAARNKSSSVANQKSGDASRSAPVTA